MTETEWRECDAPEKMLEYLYSLGGATERKARLFICACLLAVWDSVADERSRSAVEVGERFADGTASEQDRVAAFRKATKAVSSISDAVDATWDLDTYSG